ncbi:MAG: hypothetical protein RPR28_06665 [Cycloclasticus sp.]
MHIALDRTLILLISHKELMFQFIDYMDQNHRKEIPSQVFIHCLKAKLERITKKSEVERLSEAFDLHNLIKADIVTEYNRSRGTIAFQPSVIEIFRLFDKERVRGLRSAELESIRFQLDSCLQQHQQSTFSVDDPDFREQREQLFDLLRKINSQVKNNTAHLQHEVDRLSNRLDHDHAVLTLDDSQQVQEALLQVRNIFDREIIPILEFLNSREQSKNKMPLTLVDEISQLYQRKGFEDDCYYIDQYKLSILSHYKAVEKVKLALQRYLHQERSHRLTYNALEQSYLHLQQLAQQSFTENLKDKYILKPLSQEALYYSGLKTHSAAQDATTEWFDKNHSVYFNEHLIQQKSRQRSQVVANISTVHRRHPREPGNLLKREITNLVANSRLKPPVADLYLALHGLLVDHLAESYQLAYLLYAVSCFKQKKLGVYTLKVHFSYPQQQIRYKNSVLQYNRRELVL